MSHILTFACYLEKVFCVFKNDKTQGTAGASESTKHYQHQAADTGGHWVPVATSSQMILAGTGHC